MKIPFLDLSRFSPELKIRLKEKFSSMLDRGIFSGGEEVFLLEKQISQKLTSPQAISCANGTDALELALRALGIGPGDEVIVPAMTWVSTAEAVVQVGAKPIFWDTDRKGLLRADWDQAITFQTKAVIPVHLYGQMVEMEPLLAKARAHKLWVIEDAAQAFGAFQSGKAAGTWGDMGCLSFYPTKNLGGLGEAGMCLTAVESLAQTLRLLINHGQPIRDEHVLVGKNSRVDTLQAGFLNVLLEEFDHFQHRRKELASRYLSKLSGLQGLIFPEGLLNSDHNAHLFVITTKKRDELRDFLTQKGIGTAVHYPKIIPDMKPYQMGGDFENARKLAAEGLSLPLNPWISDEEVDYVIAAIRDFFDA